MGCGITKRDVLPKPLALTLGRKPAAAYLWLAYTTQMDPEGEFLTVFKSGYALYRDPEGERWLLHYDYEREPSHEYPAAHVQVNGDAPDLGDLFSQRCEGQKQLKDFHLPVGGRRYRPTLEDLIEFVVTEGLADAHEGWQDVLAEHRSEWEDLQLRAAVRRDPETALDQLRRSGHLT